MKFWDELFKHNQGNFTYRESAQLFAQIFPEKKSLIKFFKKEDRYSRKRLKDELDRKFTELRAHKESVDFKSFSSPKKKIDLEKLPEDLRKKHARLGPIIREISHLHAQLYKCSRKKERFDLAVQIHALSTERRFIFMEIDYFQDKGKELNKAAAPVVRTAAPETKNFEIEYKLKLLRTQRTKLAKNSRRTVELNEVKKQITDLEKKRYG